MSDHLIAEANRHAMALPTTQPTHADIAWYVREVSELRAELALLREWQREVIQNANAHHAERKEAIARAEKVEAELAGIRALADRRNKRYHVEDTTHQLVAALDQALDIAQAELAAERARLDWLESKCPILWSLADHATGPYWLLTDFPGYTEETASQHKTARAAIDAAMKEGA